MTLTDDVLGILTAVDRPLTARQIAARTGGTKFTDNEVKRVRGALRHLEKSGHAFRTDGFVYTEGGTGWAGESTYLRYSARQRNAGALRAIRSALNDKFPLPPQSPRADADTMTTVQQLLLAVADLTKQIHDLDNRMKEHNF